jgi:polyisoprenoid-binding protein YceI
MKNVFFTLILSVFSAGLMNAQTKLTADTGKTTLNWLGEKVTGQHTGTVNLKSGWLTMKENRIVGGEFLIDMTTIKDSGGNARLEGHLKSDDFFGVEKFPVAMLVLKSSDSFDKGSAVVKGELTIKGVTNPIEFKAVVQHKDDGTYFFSNIVIDRTTFNVRYGSGTFFDNLGDKTIYDDFQLKVALVVK